MIRARSLHTRTFLAGCLALITLPTATAKAESSAIVSPAVGSKFQPCKNCPVFVRVPTGRKPLRKLEYVAINELTWREYIASYLEGACQIPQPNARLTNLTKKEIESKLDDYKIDWPIAILTPTDVDCYVKWLQTKIDFVVALPTSREWEWFAQATLVSAKYPWGDDPKPSHEALELDDASFTRLLPYQPEDKRSRVNQVIRGVRVGNYPPNEWGIYDIMGNSHELTNELFSDEGWRKRKNIARLAGDTSKFYRILIKGSDYLGSDWLNGIKQEHFALIVDNKYSTYASVRIVLINEDN